jgi:hypothetical protein
MPFERLRERNKPEPTDKILGPTNRDLLNAILENWFRRFAFAACRKREFAFMSALASRR